MRAVDFVSSYVDAWNQKDANCIADHLTQDGEYFDVPTGRHHPKPKLAQYLASFFAEDNHEYSLAGEINTGENTIAFQYKSTFCDSRGEPATWFGAEFVTLAGNQAVHIADYYKYPSEQDHRPAGKYARSGLSEEQLEMCKTKLNDLMEQDRVYLDPSLTLPKLSTIMNCPVNHLSQVINAGFGMSFFDYLNSYRINEAKKMLVDPGDRPPAILTVAFDVGFNSNSAFYSAFKRSCGQTPAQYRRENRNRQGGTSQQ